MIIKKIKQKAIPIIPVINETERDLMLSNINKVAENVDPALKESVLSILSDIKFKVTRSA